MVVLKSHRHGDPVEALCAVITISDTRIEETDTSGQQIKELLLANGHQVKIYKIISDEPGHIRNLLENLIQEVDVQVIVLNGGTGISSRDHTSDIVESFLEKKLPGFGEVFRVLSYQDVGAVAVLSRALAGITNSKVIFSLPGSKKAVSLAMEKLILPSLSHLLAEIAR